MLINEIKSRYKDRYIIFDSSPLLATADPISLGGLMDGVLLVIQEGRVSQGAVSQALSLTKGWNMLGVVFNNASESNATKSRYSYYRYGKKSEQKKSETDEGRA
jgi:receptor protein-tyrosine kinase/non-specific protein-tyrosine kinase